MPKNYNFNEYLTKLKIYYSKHKSIPNFEKVCNIVGLKSKSGVSRLFNKLVELNYLSKEGNKYLPSSKFLSLPLYESIRAGFPTPGTDEVKEDLDINSFLVSNYYSTYLLKVKGDSMNLAGIIEGDIIVVDKSLKPKDGDIVVAMVDGEFTLKYYKKDPESKKFKLIPANPNYPEIVGKEEIIIFGVVISQFRSYINSV